MEFVEVEHLLMKMVSAAREDEFEYRNWAGEALSDELCEMLGERAERAAIYRREIETLLHGMGAHAAAIEQARGKRHGGARARAHFGDEVLLVDCERKEDELLVRYRDILEEDLPAEARCVFERQFAALLDERVYASEIRLHGCAAAQPGSEMAVETEGSAAIHR